MCLCLKCDVYFSMDRKKERKDTAEYDNVDTVMEHAHKVAIFVHPFCVFLQCSGLFLSILT